jgi:hypothetical protein
MFLSWLSGSSRAFYDRLYHRLRWRSAADNHSGFCSAVLPLPTYAYHLCYNMPHATGAFLLGRPTLLPAVWALRMHPLPFSVHLTSILLVPHMCHDLPSMYAFYRLLIGSSSHLLQFPTATATLFLYYTVHAPGCLTGRPSLAA